MTASSTRLERAVIVVSQAARPGKTLDIARAKNARIRGAQTNAYSARDVDRPVVIFLKRISRIKLSYDISVKLHATYFYLTREMYTHRCVKTSRGIFILQYYYLSSCDVKSMCRNFCSCDIKCNICCCYYYTTAIYFYSGKN